MVRSHVHSVCQPVVPRRLDLRHVEVPVLVLNPSCAHVDFVLSVVLKVLVAVGVDADECTGLDITDGVDLLPGTLGSYTQNVADSTD